MKNFEIWSEGYLATGMEGVPAEAQKLGEYEADTFRDACVGWLRANDPDGSRFGRFDEDRLEVWGCRLFDNETDARTFMG